MTKTYGNFTDFIDFTRSSSATYLDSDGLIKTAADNVPRVEYDANGVLKGLLIEEARTNLFPESEDFAGSYYAPTGATIESGATTAPDGTLTACSITENTASSTHQVYDYNAISAASGVTYTFSLYAKQNVGSRYLKLTTQSSAFGSEKTANFDVTAGQVTVHNGDDASVENVGNGWFRLIFTVTAVSTASTSIIIRMEDTDDVGYASYQGDGVSSIYIWGLQAEQGSFATSYIPTSGAQATRSADIASIATSNFGYNPKAGTVVVEYSIVAFDGNQTLFTLGETSGNLGIGWYSSTGHHRVSAAGLNSTTSYPIGSSDLEADVEYTSAIYYAQSDVGISVDGGSVVSGSSYDPPLATVLKIGDDLNGGNSFNGHIKSLSYRPRRNSNNQLQEFTS